METTIIDGADREVSIGDGIASGSGRKVPVTVLTGFLGSGKTTIIVHLMRRLPSGYRIAWLKNEIGNTAVDTALAEDGNIATVKEMLQGCICHVLVGQLGQALTEMLVSDPDRIIIETSGSAAPAPIVWEIRKHPRLVVDGVVTVIDAVNFPGYRDKSLTAKLQAQYTDLILINKHEELPEAKLDHALDDVYELNPDTPKVKTDRGVVSPGLLFGLDSRLFETEASVREEESHTDPEHQSDEVELIEITFDADLDRDTLCDTLGRFPKSNFYRIKGVIRIGGEGHVLNWAFGSFQAVPIRKPVGRSKIVFMGEDLSTFLDTVKASFPVREGDVRYTPKGHHHHHGHRSCPSHAPIANS